MDNTNENFNSTKILLETLNLISSICNELNNLNSITSIESKIIDLMKMIDKIIDIGLKSQK